MSAMIETRQLCKRYGAHQALSNLDLTIEEGEIFGYLGPNGAGKTTTLRILLGLLRASSGTARIFGRDCWAESVTVRRSLGYLPGDVRVYDGLSGRRNLRLLARLRGVPCSFEPLAQRLASISTGRPAPTRKE